MSRPWIRLAFALCLTSTAAACGHKATRGPSPVASGSTYGPAGDASPSASNLGTAPAPPTDDRDAGAAESMARSEASPGTPSRSTAGLGTSYGEQRRSDVVDVSFTRGSSEPDAVLALWYDDHRNLGRSSLGHDRATSTTSDGTFVLSVSDEMGHPLDGTRVGDRQYVLGTPGQRYVLGIENHSPFRYEVVASVDGLDVVDGDVAGYHKRGYVLEPYSSMTVEGWRTSQQTVAAFRFSSLADAYAERRGMGRNIGVIGAAFFHEHGAEPWPEFTRARHQVDPFPNRFAPPPPSRRAR